MSRAKCRHPISKRLIWLEGEIEEDSVPINLCGRCRAWLSLGPSNDDSEAVHVEIRAAELAPEDCEAAEFTVREWCGFAGEEDYVSGSDGALKKFNLSERQWSAGYLAARIADHQERDDG